MILTSVIQEKIYPPLYGRVVFGKPFLVISHCLESFCPCFFLHLFPVEASCRRIRGSTERPPTTTAPPLVHNFDVDPMLINPNLLIRRFSLGEFGGESDHRWRGYFGWRKSISHHLRNSGNDDSPVNCQQTMVSHAFKVV